MRLHPTLLSSLVALATSLSLDAAITYGTLETFTIVADTTYDGTSNWAMTSSVTNSVRVDASTATGNDMATAATNDNTLRIYRAAGEITFAPALTLVTDSATSLTVELDYQGKSNGNILGLQYSALGDFSDAVSFGTIDNSAPNTTIARDQTFTATNGAGGISFTDTAKIRILVTGGSTSTSDGTWVDNISVTAVPEPSSLLLFGFGGLALALCRRR